MIDTIYPRFLIAHTNARFSMALSSLCRSDHQIEDATFRKVRNDTYHGHLPMKKNLYIVASVFVIHHMFLALESSCLHRIHSYQ